MSKMKISLWINPKMLQTTERHSLAVCGSLCGEKQFLLIFIPFYWCDKKPLFKQIQILLRICLFKHGKKNKLYEYFSVRFWDSHFYVQKEKFSMNFHQNASKQQKGIVLHYVAHFVEKNIFVNIYPLLLVIKKSCLNKSKFSSVFAPFKQGKKNIISEYFSACFRHIQFYV